MKKTLYVVLSFVALFGYQNCSMIDSQHVDLSSAGAYDMKGCNGMLRPLFVQTYYPHLKSNCASCHDQGGRGIGWFANTGSESAAFSAFIATTRAKIKIKMLDDGHSGPNNGPQQQPFIDSTERAWIVAEARVRECEETTALKTIGRNNSVSQQNSANGDPNRDPWKKIEWDLYNDMSTPGLQNQIHMIVGIQYREGQFGSGPKVGYEFRNLTARIRGGAPAGTQYRIQKVNIYVNGEPLPNVTAWEAAHSVIGNAADQVVLNGAASIGAMSTWNPVADKISLRFDQIANAPGEPIGDGLPSGGGGGPVVPARVTYADLISGGQLGVFNRSCIGCHSGGNPAGGLNLQTYTAAFNARDAIVARMNDTMRPMPTGGLLDQFNRDVVRRWLEVGAPQN